MIFKIICSARRPYPVALPNHWYIAAHPDVGYPARLLPGQSSQPNIVASESLRDYSFWLLSSYEKKNPLLNCKYMHGHKGGHACKNAEKQKKLRILHFSISETQWA